MRRLFIIDPVCAQLIGHNLTCLIKYRSYLNTVGSFSEIKAFASRTLPESVSTEHDVERFFNFYYHNRMALVDESGRPIVDETSKLPNYEETQEKIAQKDFSLFVERYAPTNKDALFFPSVDFYSAVSIIDCLDKYNAEDSPHIYFKFIGVMEYACGIYTNPRRHLLQKIKRYISKGYPIHLAAESTVYADRLALEMGERIAVAPTPPHHDVLQLDSTDEFIVVSPGSGRMDKGFGLLPTIVTRFRQAYGDLKVRFLIQNLPPWELEHNISAATRLYAAPGVGLLPASLTVDEMIGLFERAHLVLMPYDPATYAFRSSAILTEAVGYSRQILTSKGTGFEDEVRYYNLGKICADANEYADRIAEYAKLKRSDLESISLQARQRYSSSCFSQYKEWLS